MLRSMSLTVRIGSIDRRRSVSNAFVRRSGWLRAPDRADGAAVFLFRARVARAAVFFVRAVRAIVPPVDKKWGTVDSRACAGDRGCAVRIAARSAAIRQGAIGL